MMPRPLSALPDVLDKMAAAAVEATDEACRAATEAVYMTVKSSGARYHIKGRGGRGKFPLGASRDVKRFGKGQGVARGAVFGIPQGFWTIVEDGSKPHIIHGRKVARGKRQGRNAGIAVKRKAAKALSSRFFGGNGGQTGANPISIPGVGWREYAHHPGHRPLGKPWEEAMAFSQRQVPEVVSATATKRFAMAFL